MRILVVSPRVPEPSAKGDQVLSFYRVSHLSRCHDVELICFGSKVDDEVSIGRLEAIGVRVKIIPFGKVNAIARALIACFDPSMPLQCAIFYSKHFKSEVRRSLVRHTPDIVYAVTIRGLENLVDYEGPLFVDMVDSMALNFSRRIRLSTGVKRWLLKFEFQRVRNYERNTAQRAVRSYVVSNIDEEAVASDRVSTIPLGIDENIFYRISEVQKEPTLIFTGNMSYQPNVDAVLWFYENCWDALKSELPSLRLVVAGRSPTSGVLELGSEPMITVTGSVPEIAPLINSALVAIAPMQSGSGMQFKILEAMACGVPVVANTIGLGDIKAIPGKDLLIGDTPDEFIKSIIDLIQSNDFRNRIGQAGLRYVSSHHTWERVNATFEDSIINEMHKIA